MVKALAGQMKPAAVFARGLADVVFAVAAEEKPYFAEAGFSGKMNADGFFEISQVRKDTPAEKSGVKKGDLILAARRRAGQDRWKGCASSWPRRTGAIPL